MEECALRWERTYLEKAPHEVSWFEPVPEASLALIDAAGVPPPASILDVGGGASTLADELLRTGYTNVTVADLSPAALGRARARLGEEASRIEWIEADVRTHEFPRRYGLWHDRALFHFMFSVEDRDAYLANMRRALRPDGYLLVATFGPQGPERCSGLPVRRYGPDELRAILGEDFQLVESRTWAHSTPSGKEQQFHYALLRRSEP